MVAEEIAYAKKIELERTRGVTGDVFVDKPIVEQYRRLLRNAGELDD